MKPAAAIQSNISRLAPDKEPGADFRSTRPKAFFITGTGRCGTMLLARLLGLSRYAECEHEKYFRHQSMVSCYLTGDTSGFTQDIEQGYEHQRQCLEHAGQTLGVSSGHLYFAIPQLIDKYGQGAKFVLLVRRPEEFARSALARGFFDPSHPSFCDQIQPHPTDPIHAHWDHATPLERTLWYWSLVNGYVLNQFERLSDHSYRIIRIEDMNPSVATNLCSFLGLADITQDQIQHTLATRVNASPNQADASEPNPYSKQVTLPPVEEWAPLQRELLQQYTGPLRAALYDSDVKIHTSATATNPDQSPHTPC